LESARLRREAAGVNSIRFDPPADGLSPFAPGEILPCFAPPEMKAAFLVGLKFVVRISAFAFSQPWFQFVQSLNFSACIFTLRLGNRVQTVADGLRELLRRERFGEKVDILRQGKIPADNLGAVAAHVNHL
jgi:hypothetical protein